jgi:CcmD family protein
MDNFGYLFAVFAIVWAVIFVYVLVLVNGQKKLRQEIDRLGDIIKEKRLDK